MLVTMFTDSPFIRNLYCGVGVLLFSIYLIIDTQLIMGGKSLELRVDEYALAALLLYIDIIQIFLYILQLLSNNNNDWLVWMLRRLVANVISIEIWLFVYFLFTVIYIWLKMVKIKF